MSFKCWLFSIVALTALPGVALAGGAMTLPDEDGVKSPPAAAPEAAKPSPPGKLEAPAVDADAPEVRAKLLDDLHKALAESKDADTAAALAGQIERVWFVSGSDTIDLLMQRAMKAVAEQDFALALQFLTAVTELQPDFAEGWNRRAYVYFRLDDTERSLGDLRRVLALEPKHYKALEGVANILKDSGSKKSALEAMRKLMEIHPFMPGMKEAIDELTREVEGQGI